MNRRQNVIDVLNHKQTGCVPIDFGGTPVTGMHVSCVEALRTHYGLEKRPVKVSDPYQMLGLIEDDLLDVLGVDIMPLSSGMTIFGFRNENWKEWKTPWGQKVLVAENFNTSVDSNGDILVYPQGDITVSASGRMPKSGFFFDAVIRQNPIDENNLNPEDNLEEFCEITDLELEVWKKEIDRIKDSDRAVFAGIGGMAFGDIALVPAIHLKNPKGIRDIAEWYMSTVIRKDYVHRIFEKQSDIAINNLNRLLPILKNSVDIAFICGTDFGTQRSTFCSPKTYKSLYMPYYKKINDWIHKNTQWKTFKHSCGAVKSFIPLFIESGFDILNPVQCSADGMDPIELKKEFGDDIVFWGGGVDTQKTLPFGTPGEVRKEVLKRCEIFSKNGGFVFNAVHNVQAKTPTENIVAMLDAVHEFNG